MAAGAAAKRSSEPALEAPCKMLPAPPATRTIAGPSLSRPMKAIARTRARSGLLERQRPAQTRLVGQSAPGRSPSETCARRFGQNHSLRGAKSCRRMAGVRGSPRNGAISAGAPVRTPQTAPSCRRDDERAIEPAVAHRMHRIMDCAVLTSSHWPRSIEATSTNVANVNERCQRGGGRGREKATFVS